MVVEPSGWADDGVWVGDGMSQGGGAALGRARFSQELAHAGMVRMELPQRPVEQVWFREGTL